MLDKNSPTFPKINIANIWYKSQTYSNGEHNCYSLLAEF